MRALLRPQKRLLNRYVGIILSMMLKQTDLAGWRQAASLRRMLELRVVSSGTIGKKIGTDIHLTQSNYLI